MTGGVHLLNAVAQGRHVALHHVLRLASNEPPVRRLRKVSLNAVATSTVLISQKHLGLVESYNRVRCEFLKASGLTVI